MKEGSVMSKIDVRNLKGVAETLLLPLIFRAAESQRSDAILRDPAAVETVNRLEYDPGRVLKKSRDQVTVLMRMREFDRCARAFLNQHPDGVVIDIGCGLDTRFQRLDNGTFEWYGLDLPEVIALRRQLLDETPRSHFLACSALDFAWLDLIDTGQERAFLFLAEGVFMLLEGEQVRSLVCTLRNRFPGAELAFDAFTPFMVRMNPVLHPLLKKINVTMHWGLKDNRELETWAGGIQFE
jgi:O-methyltransferase involved in polyketide biosynthesis